MLSNENRSHPLDQSKSKSFYCMTFRKINHLPHKENEILFKPKPLLSENERGEKKDAKGQASFL
jgi:hypothetical protein